jgi:hypothetical protein
MTRPDAFDALAESLAAARPDFLRVQLQVGRTMLDEQITHAMAPAGNVGPRVHRRRTTKSPGSSRRAPSSASRPRSGRH